MPFQCLRAPGWPGPPAPLRSTASQRTLGMRPTKPFRCHLLRQRVSRGFRQQGWFFPPACTPLPALGVMALGAAHHPRPSPAPLPGPVGCSGESVSASYKKLGNSVADRLWKARKEEKPGLSFQIHLRKFGGEETKRFWLLRGRSRRRGEWISSSLPHCWERACLYFHFAYFPVSSFSGRGQVPVQKWPTQKAAELWEEFFQPSLELPSAGTGTKAPQSQGAKAPNLSVMLPPLQSLMQNGFIFLVMLKRRQSRVGRGEEMRLCRERTRGSRPSWGGWRRRWARMRSASSYGETSHQPTTKRVLKQSPGMRLWSRHCSTYPTHHPSPLPHALPWLQTAFLLTKARPRWKPFPLLPSPAPGDRSIQAREKRVLPQGCGRAGTRRRGDPGCRATQLGEAREEGSTTHKSHKSQALRTQGTSGSLFRLKCVCEAPQDSGCKGGGGSARQRSWRSWWESFYKGAIVRRRRLTKIQLEKWRRKKKKKRGRKENLLCNLCPSEAAPVAFGAWRSRCCLGSLRSLLRKGHEEKHEFSRRLIIQTAPDPASQVPVTLEDEQSYLRGEKDHLLFTIRERKLTIGTRGNLENMRAGPAGRRAQWGEGRATLLRGAGLPGGHAAARDAVLAKRSFQGNKTFLRSSRRVLLSERRARRRWEILPRQSLRRLVSIFLPGGPAKTCLATKRTITGNAYFPTGLVWAENGQHLTLQDEGWLLLSLLPP